MSSTHKYNIKYNIQNRHMGKKSQQHKSIQNNITADILDQSLN